MNPAVPGLVPHRVEHWRVQQGRWVQGFVQTARKLGSAIWSSNWSLIRKTSVWFLLLYQLIFPIMVVAVASGLLDFALRRGQLPLFPSVLAAIVVSMIPLVALSMTLPPYLALRRGSLAQFACTLVMMPPLIMYLAFANIAPMLAAIFGRSGPFHRTPKGEPELPPEEEPVSAWVPIEARFGGTQSTGRAKT
jgi:cellulose synthase/poly-beta-1,6-N-acetylglucosamine synthase-like glycosyltransferase